MMHPLFASIILCVLATGCGYHFGESGISSQYKSISIPYIKGDLDGSFTNSLINEVVTRGIVEYRRDSGDLLLLVKLIELRDENIGFRYDRKKRGELTHSIIPTETRITANTEVTLVEAAKGEVLLGPVILTASVDFDHDYYFSRNGVNIFSLGQLTDIDEAKDAVKCPLNKVLSQKIVDYMIECW